MRKPTATNLLIFTTFSHWVIGSPFYHLIINTFHNMFELKYHEVNLWRCLGQLAKDNSVSEFSEWWTRFTWPRTLPIAFEKIARLSVILAFRHRHGHWHSGASGFVKLSKEIFRKCDLLFDFKELIFFRFKAIFTRSAISAIANDLFLDFIIIIEVIMIIWNSSSSCVCSSSDWWWSMISFTQTNNWLTNRANNNTFFLMRMVMMLMLMISSFVSFYLNFHGIHNKFCTEFVYFCRHSRHLGDLLLNFRIGILNET